MSASGVVSRDLASRQFGLIVPIVLVGAVLVLIAPISPSLLDAALSANIAAAVVILLQTIYIRRPRDFSVFPTLLLTTTLVRLVLNVASTRLILTQAPIHGSHAAGGVIEAFGDFVAAGSPLVGGVVFAILVVIQFVVITQGATRISEVAARFALDGMPGRQMAVDADLSAGLITAEQARDRREEIARQADFYGAMDGASKFVRGDAVAGVLITFVNILGGLAIGVLREGMPLEEALSIFTTLTIGDGLVSQVPAFLISLAAGLIITRASSESDLPGELLGQVLAHPLPLYVGAAFLAVLAFSGFPMLPMLTLAAGCAAGGWMLSQRPVEVPVAEPEPVPDSPSLTRRASSPLGQQLLVEPLELDLGVSLVRLADRASGGELLEQVTSLRDRLAADLGFVLPKVKIQDDLRLDPREFRIKLRGVATASGTVYSDAVLAVDDGFVAGKLSGIEGIEPATHRPGVWIDPADAEHARGLGFRLVPPHAILLQTLEGVVRRHAGELLTREHVHALLNHLRDSAPRLVDELIPGRLSGADVHRVLATLLSESVPVRDLETILEALGDAAARSRSQDDLAAAARFALRRTIVQRLSDSRGLLHVVVLNEHSRSSLDEQIAAAVAIHPDRSRLLQVLPWLNQLLESIDRLVATKHRPAVLCHSDLRPRVQELLRQVGSSTVVLGHRELPPDTQTRVHAEVTLDSRNTAPSPDEFDSVLDSTHSHLRPRQQYALETALAEAAPSRSVRQELVRS